MRRSLTGLTMGLALLALPSLAFAQAACPISAETVKVVSPVNSPPSYNLTAADHCSMIVSTVANQWTVNLPNANTLPAGFKVLVKAQGSGTVVLGAPAGGGNLDNAASSANLGPSGIGTELRADGTNYWTLGQPPKH